MLSEFDSAIKQRLVTPKAKNICMFRERVPEEAAAAVRVQLQGFGKRSKEENLSAKDVQV
jgi:hypothetical protein